MKSHDTQFPAGDFRLLLHENGTWPDQMVVCALLADIRRELKRMNNVLQCHNTATIPHT